MKSNVSDGQSPDPFPLLCMTGKSPSLHNGLSHLTLHVGALPLLVTSCGFGAVSCLKDARRTRCLGHDCWIYC